MAYQCVVLFTDRNPLIIWITFHAALIRVIQPNQAARIACAPLLDQPAYGFDGQAKRPEGMSRELMLALFVEANAQTRRILKRKGLIGAEG